MSLQCKMFGYAIYYSQFERQKKLLESLCLNKRSVFTSLHISEEVDAAYVSGVKDMCAYLHERGFEIIADVSNKTLEVFDESDIVLFAKKMHIAALRIDCGFSVQETASIAERMPVYINASTVDCNDAAIIAKRAVSICALHNFYPRPETALDAAFFKRKNAALAALGMQTAAFVPSDIQLRGPLYEGLPTLEAHRGVAPWAAFCDMCETYCVDAVFSGDGIVSQFDALCIDEYCSSGIISVPVRFDAPFSHLYDAVFTVRSDSPASLLRLAESREYAQQGKPVAPQNCALRARGAVTIDNENYKRYSGEIQIVKKDFPSDSRVNVIGHVPKKYALLLDAIPNGRKIRFRKMTDEENICA